MNNQLCGCKWDNGLWVELCHNHRHAKPNELPTLRQIAVPAYRVADYQSAMHSGGSADPERQGIEVPVIGSAPSGGADGGAALAGSQE
jgi:hypothetical protein